MTTPLGVCSLAAVRARDWGRACSLKASLKEACLSVPAGLDWCTRPTVGCVVGVLLYLRNSVNFETMASLNSRPEKAPNVVGAGPLQVLAWTLR
jgi:hypothetical protein